MEVKIWKIQLIPSKTSTYSGEKKYTPCFLLIPFYYIEQIYINDAFIKNIYW
jgi:sulfur relay (sulfurtransferase) DsrF/TusC family protein